MLNIHLAMVVRTNARASRALFLGSSPRIWNTVSFSHGDRISKYWFNKASLFTSLGITYHKWVSLQPNKITIIYHQVLICNLTVLSIKERKLKQKMVNIKDYLHWWRELNGSQRRWRVEEFPVKAMQFHSAVRSAHQITIELTQMINICR